MMSMKRKIKLKEKSNANPFKLRSREQIWNGLSKETRQTDSFETPNGTRKPRVYPQSKSYSTVLQSKLPVTPKPNTPLERKREQHISLIDNKSATTVSTMKLPSPKQGKKNVEIGRPIEVRQMAPRNVNPFSKAIWISKFHPETTPEIIENYITEHTAVKDKSKFKCIKLVKKDQDVAKMSFVSFKIDVVPEIFDILIDPENWPQNKQIREFIKMTPPKTTLGNFLPSPKPQESTNATSVTNAEQQQREHNEYMMDIAVNELGLNIPNDFMNSTSSKND